MRERFQRMKLWGADPEETIGRMMDDEAFYDGLLVKFLDKKEWEALECAVSQQRYPDAFQIAHDLKGVTATLGLTPLWLALSGVVEDLRGEPGAELGEDLDSFFRELAVFEGIMKEE